MMTTTAIVLQPRRDRNIVRHSKNARTRADFAKLITEAWQSSLDGIFRTGLWLETAKAELPHGEWIAMIENDLPFGARTAQRLKAIVENDNLTNTTHASLLPLSWDTLYTLAKLDEDTFSAAIADGRINPKMQRKDAMALRPDRPHKPRKPKAAPLPDRSRLPDPIDACLVDVLQIVNETINGTAQRDAIDPSNRAKLFAELRAAVDRMEQQVSEEENHDHV